MSAHETPPRFGWPHWLGIALLVALFDGVRNDWPLRDAVQDSVLMGGVSAGLNGLLAVLVVMAVSWVWRKART